MFVRILALSSLCLAFILTGCSTAQYQQMVPTALHRITLTHKPITVQDIKTSIKTGRTAPLEIATFHQALSAALEKTGMFKSVQSTPVNKGYRLETSLTRQKFQLKDRAAHFTIATRYVFVNHFNQVIYSTDITANCTKTPGDHTIGTKRERRAIECGVKKNLSALLDKLYFSQHNFR